MLEHYRDPRVQAFASMFHFGVLGEEKTISDCVEEAANLRRSGLNIEAFDCEITMLDASREALNGYCKLHVPIGYPGGNVCKAQKLHQLEYILKKEVEDSCFCLDYSAISEGEWREIERETREVMELCENRLPIAMVIQSTLFNDRQIADVCKAVIQGGGNRVKLNTGYGWGTSLEEVALIRNLFGKELDIHPSGNIRRFEQVKSFLDYGVTIIHSASVFDIIDEFATYAGIINVNSTSKEA